MTRYQIGSIKSQAQENSEMEGMDALLEEIVCKLNEISFDNLLLVEAKIDDLRAGAQEMETSISIPIQVQEQEEIT